MTHMTHMTLMPFWQLWPIFVSGAMLLLSRFLRSPSIYFEIDLD